MRFYFTYILSLHKNGNSSEIIEVLYTLYFIVYITFMSEIQDKRCPFTKLYKAKKHLGRLSF